MTNPPKPRFRHASMKQNRADWHIGGLNHLITEFARQSAYQLWVEREAQTGKYVLY